MLVKIFTFGALLSCFDLPCKYCLVNLEKTNYSRGILERVGRVTANTRLSNFWFSPKTREALMLFTCVLCVFQHTFMGHLKDRCTLTIYLWGCRFACKNRRSHIVNLFVKKSNLRILVE